MTDPIRFTGNIIYDPVAGTATIQYAGMRVTGDVVRYDPGNL